MARSLEYPVDCEHVVRALWDYLDRELDEADRAVVDTHLAACDHCRAHAVFERQLIDAIRRLRTQHDEPDLARTRVLDMLRRARSADPER
jgi:anti-sigma factor (TIGR02949 family)